MSSLTPNNINMATSQLWNKSFDRYYGNIWNKTIYANRVNDLSFNHFLSIWTHNDTHNLTDRNLLMFNYLSYNFGVAYDDTIQRMRPILPIDNSIVQRVINNQCVIYDKTPIITNKDEPNDIKTAEIVDLLNDSNFFNALQQSYKIARLISSVAILTTIINNELTFNVLKPDCYVDVWNNTGELIEVWIPDVSYDKNANEVIEFTVFTQEEIQKRNEKGIFISSVENMITDLNGTKIIPIQIRKISNNDVWGGANNELITGQMAVNQNQLSSQQAALFNSYKTLHAINMKWVSRGMKLGVNRMLISEDVKISGDLKSEIEPSLEVIDLAGEFDSLQGFKNVETEEIYKKNGLPSSLIKNNPGIAASGVALEMDFRELMEIRKEDSPILNLYDRQLLNIVQYVLNSSEASKYKNQFSKEVIWLVEYQFSKVIFNEKEYYETQTAKYKDGVITPREYVSNVTSLNFNSDEEAIDYLNNNLENLEKVNTPKIIETEVPEEEEIKEEIPEEEIENENE